MKQERDLLRDAVIGELTQGSIFTGAVSSLYPDNKRILGIIISPRCDIAQDKVPLFYYLPVIPFDLWMQKEFPGIYIKRFKGDTLSSLQNAFKNNGISATLIGRFTIDDLKKVVESQVTKKKTLQGINDKLDIYKLIEDASITSDITKLKSKDKSLNRYNSILTELAKGNLPDYYLFEKDEQEMFVIRMREIKRLSPSVFHKLAEGIDKPFKKEELIDNDLSTFSEGDIYMPLYVVNSPFIEHIMQHFLHLFNRIGIPDFPTDLIIK